MFDQTVRNSPIVSTIHEMSPASGGRFPAPPRK